jgi:hypothetical protein
MRLQPDLDSHVVREISKNEMLSIVSQEGDYYAVEPPMALKAYVFRSFVLDGIVEGNRVNVRLEPDLEAPVIGHLNSGDRISGQISEQNRKWLEISPPSNTLFYVAKDFIEYAGGPELKEQMAQRKETAEQLLEAAKLFAKAEMENTFEEIDFEKIKEGFLTIIHDYTDFPQKAELAKDALTSAQEEYLQKRIAYLEEKAALATSYVAPQGRKAKQAKTLEAKTWQGVEQGLFAAWQENHQDQAMDDFYQEQKMLAKSVSGVLEIFSSPVKNKPGNYVLKKKNLPVAYLYSTSLNLEEHVGNEVTIVGSPRDNHNFAFPAYFVHEVQ